VLHAQPVQCDSTVVVDVVAKFFSEDSMLRRLYIAGVVMRRFSPRAEVSCIYCSTAMRGVNRRPLPDTSKNRLALF